MVEKFDDLQSRFREMYMDDVPYSEICEALGIGDGTARDWRRKLGLPVRLGNEPISWMDAKKLNGMSPREIVGRIAGSFGIRDQEIPLILERFYKLRQKLSGGRNLTHLLLTGVYEYLRWPPSGKQPASASTFVKVCYEKDVPIGRSALLNLSRLYKEAGLFPAKPMSASQLLEIRWPVLKAKFGLPDEMKSVATAFISEVNLEGRIPEGIVAAALYVGARSLKVYMSQDRLSSFFGITEVTLRNIGSVILAHYESSALGANGSGAAA
ncbi:MAG: hypothetical protein JRM82_04590 [Nitrososphaerota archaeon]|nr:hypothetical protein [Nitrososphaerota archaeon]